MQNNHLSGELDVLQDLPLKDLYIFFAIPSSFLVNLYITCHLLTFFFINCAGMSRTTSSMDLYQTSCWVYQISCKLQQFSLLVSNLRSANSATFFFSKYQSADVTDYDAEKAVTCLTSLLLLHRLHLQHLQAQHHLSGRFLDHHLPMPQLVVVRHTGDHPLLITHPD